LNNWEFYVKYAATSFYVELFMLKVITGAIASLVFISTPALAQSYQSCRTETGVYETGIFYEYGAGYPAVLDSEGDLSPIESYMSFPRSDQVTMYAATEDRQILMVSGEIVDIYGLKFMNDCSLQLLIYSPRLELLGVVPSETVAIPY
jgi:hypothetical protein